MLFQENCRGTMSSFRRCGQKKHRLSHATSWELGWLTLPRFYYKSLKTVAHVSTARIMAAHLFRLG